MPQTVEAINTRALQVPLIVAIKKGIADANPDRVKHELARTDVSVIGLGSGDGPVLLRNAESNAFGNHSAQLGHSQSALHPTVCLRVGLEAKRDARAWTLRHSVVHHGTLRTHVIHRRTNSGKYALLMMW